MAASLSLSDQTWLLQLARRTLENLGPGAQKPLEIQIVAAPIPESGKDPSGVFVTLHRNRILRGCVGYVTPIMPLYEAVIENTVNAARNDPRFSPVEKEEVPQLHVEISVMSPPREIRDLSEIEIGRSGLIVESGMNRGLLLPQVATEMRWDAETFLSNTCRKAGLRMDAWRKETVTIREFSAQVFCEPHGED